MYKITVVIPIYKNENIIDEIESKIVFLLNKKYQIILIDDCSNDGSYERLKIFKQRINNPSLILFVNQKNMGPSYARNRGIKEASGEWIAFLDSDDEWHPQKIELQIKMMKDNNVKICGTMHKVIGESELESENKKDYFELKNVPITKVKWPKILFVSPFATPSVVIHCSLKNYLFDETIRYSEDYNLWKRITYKHDAIKILLPLTYTFKHDYLSDGNSLSTNLKKMQNGITNSFLLLIKSSNVKYSDKPILFLALLFSQLKYLRRLIKSKFKWI